MDHRSLTTEERAVLRRMFLRSHLVFQGFNMVKMEANGFTMTMQPAIESLYKDDPEGRKEAYLRHQSFFNTHAVPFSFIAGVSYAMERDLKEKKAVDGATIASIKAALMGPTAGMFDSLFFNALRIIAAGIAIGLAAQGNVLGPILFVLLYGVSQSVVKYYFTNWGYTLGTSMIDTVFKSGLMAALTKAAAVLGLTMMGAMTAKMVNVPLQWTIQIGGASLVVQDVINSIMPGLLSVLLVFGLVALIRRGVRPTWLVVIILATGVLGALVGIFGTAA
ncbi:MAG: PTS system mannose/fructose/sorbose family transporter subunit IID [Propionicimonas sp.]|uniref:PTS system mannose/fructose/sorbose family transporter subunit IID n=1 Tax=Propionicimonas sp. TaxID=1955623 RepID=UPI003D0E2E41